MIFSIHPHRHLPLAYRSGFWLLITLLMLSSGPAYAEWVTVSVIDQAGATVYVDPTTIHRQGARVTMSELIDYRAIQTVTGTAFVSTRLHREYDCARDRHRTLALTKSSGRMGTGTVTLTNSEVQNWEPADPGSIGKRLWRIACDKK
jgi:hypothetical protein